MLSELSRDKNAIVRESVAGNKTTSIDILVMLARETIGSYIQVAVGRNPNTPARTVIRLACDEFFEIREGGAGNPDIQSIYV